MPEPGWQSFVGLHALPVRHGMTIAELAAYLNETQMLGADLTVVPMSGWRRSMGWADTGLPWVAPSPNMPTPDTAADYPGGCLIERTNLSEGRGTTRQFELCGAPFLDGAALARGLGQRHLPGARFRAVTIEPTFHKWAGRRCGGVQVHVTDPRRFRPVLTYLALIGEARRQAPRRFSSGDFVIGTASFDGSDGYAQIDGNILADGSGTMHVLFAAQAAVASGIWVRAGACGLLWIMN